MLGRKFRADIGGRFLDCRRVLRSVMEAVERRRKGKPSAKAVCDG